MNTTTIALGELADIVSGGTPSRSEPSFFGGDVPWVKIGDMLQGTIVTTEETITRAGVAGSAAKLLPRGTLLLSIFATIGRTAVLDLEAATNQAIAGITIKDETRLDRGYLRRYLEFSSPELARQGRGVAQANINLSILRAHRIPVPALEEQRRIAAVLDAADALRGKRRLTLAKLDTLTQAIFVNTFGDLSAFEARPFGSLLVMPLRNGISPSKSGLVAGDVLTLSAITRRRFDSTAVKQSTFARSHSADSTVSAEDFLICRGNGNLGLVGRGKHPDVSMPSVAFPDTMIGARCDSALVARGFLNHVWDGDLVRRQLESAARTTNGTYKINQTMIETVRLPLPPIEMQRGFDAALQAIRLQSTRCERSANALNALFASIQQGAFGGDL